MKQSTSTTHRAHPVTPEAPPDPAATLKPLDPGRVNSMDPVELRYWARQFGCTEERLMQAVEQVGEHVAAVRECLGIRH
jgi:hypothetical protein